MAISVIDDKGEKKEVEAQDLKPGQRVRVEVLGRVFEGVVGQVTKGGVPVDPKKS